jgi:hypothetical protein
MGLHRQPLIGVILLDTRFPRPPGDIGQALTYSRAGLAVRFERVPQASAQRVVRQADARLLQPFIDTARSLEQAGATLITTSCGFLARYQQVLQAAVSVPVLSSSLLWCRHLTASGIVTFDADSLSADVLQGAGVPPGTPIRGLEPGCLMHKAILEDHADMNLAQAQRDVVDASLKLVEQHPHVREIVLECANMPPYREAIAQATGRRVHDLETLLIEQVRAMGLGA